MQYFFYSFLIWTVIWPTAASTGLCPAACESALSYVVFAGNTTTQQCTNRIRIVSYYSCLRKYCLEEADEAYAALQKTCKRTTVMPKTADITTDLEGLAEITANDLYRKTPLKRPVALTESLYSLSVRTITSASAQNAINLYYGYAMYGFWAVVLLASGLVQLWKSIVAQTATIKRAGVTQKIWARQASRRLRQHVIVPPLAGKRTAEKVGWCTVPPRLQSLIIIAFVAVNLGLCISSYDVFPGNLKRPTIPKQVTRLIGRRTGSLIMANLPLMWTFAMRNNLLSWVSGWSFATFSSFHRWIARVVMAELVVHAVAYSLSEYYSGSLSKYYAQWPQEYWCWGVVSIIAGSFSSASAIYPVRRHFYDAFLLGHIVLATLFLVGTWFHIKKQGHEFDMYFWPCVAVWAFDRALRLGRVLALNLPTKRADIVYNLSSDMIHLEIPARSIIHQCAGTYYYVYVLQGLKFWESHPFTLHSWERQDDDNGRRTTLKFLIRPQDGVTSRLKNLAIQNADTERGSHMLQKQSVFAIVEGPYGHTSDMSSHTSALFVVGGSGITVAMSHLRSLSAMIERGQEVKIRAAHIVWAVRHAELASGVLEDDIMPWFAQSKIGLNIDITFDIHATQGTRESTSDASDTSISIEPKSAGESLGPSKGLDKDGVSQTVIRRSTGISKEEGRIAVRSYTGRPLLQDICLSFADDASSVDGRAALVCCGPPAMADDVRVAVVRALQIGTTNLDFFPESFSW